MSVSPYGLIAIDLDGTLLSPSGTLTPRTRAAIHHAVAAGYQVCFATGRSWRESLHILKEAGHHGSAVFVTGALVVDTHRAVTLHRRLMGAELARQVAAFFETRGQAALALQDCQQGDVDYLVTESAQLNDCTRQWLKMTRTLVQRRSDLSLGGHERTLRVSIVADGTDVRRCHAEMAVEFGPRVASHCLLLPTSRMQVLEVFEPAVNKWAGVAHVAELHGLASAQVVAVGDDTNDVPMLRAAGLGVAMGNARPEIAAAAHRVIGHNADDGLAAFLEELVEHHGQAAKGLALRDGRRT